MKHHEGFLLTKEGLRLSYQILGNGPDTVIVPAASWLAADLEPLAEEHTLLCYDQRSRGQSDAAADDSQLGMSYEVSDLETVRQHMGVETCTLIGHSYLGAVTTLYAAAYPERVSRLLLIGPMSPREYQYDDPRNLDADARLDPVGLQHLEAMQAAGVDVTDPVTYSREFLRVYMPLQMGNPAGLERMRSAPWKFPNEHPTAFERSFATLFANSDLEARDWRPQAAAVKVPTLVIQGLEDLIPVASSREWAASFPDARLFTMPGVGHHPWLEDPNTFFPVAREFLNGAWPEGAIQVSAG
jgi:pimeloyl-ACP methyl ester carboxylesterase